MLLPFILFDYSPLPCFIRADTLNNAFFLQGLNCSLNRAHTQTGLFLHFGFGDFRSSSDKFKNGLLVGIKSRFYPFTYRFIFAVYPFIYHTIPNGDIQHKSVIGVFGIGKSCVFHFIKHTVNALTELFYIVILMQELGDFRVAGEMHGSEIVQANNSRQTARTLNGDTVVKHFDLNVCAFNAVITVSNSVKLLELRERLKEYTGFDYSVIPESIVEAFIERIWVSKDEFRWYLRTGNNAEGEFDPDDHIKIGAFTLTIDDAKKYIYSFSTRRRVYKWADLKVSVWI